MPTKQSSQSNDKESAGASKALPSAKADHEAPDEDQYAGAALQQRFLARLIVIVVCALATSILGSYLVVLTLDKPPLLANGDIGGLEVFVSAPSITDRVLIRIFDSSDPSCLSHQELWVNMAFGSVPAAAVNPEWAAILTGQSLIDLTSRSFLQAGANAPEHTAIRSPMGTFFEDGILMRGPITTTNTIADPEDSDAQVFSGCLTQPLVAQSPQGEYAVGDLPYFGTRVPTDTADPSMPATITTSKGPSSSHRTVGAAWFSPASFSVTVTLFTVALSTPEFTLDFADPPPTSQLGPTWMSATGVQPTFSARSQAAIDGVSHKLFFGAIGLGTLTTLVVTLLLPVFEAFTARALSPRVKLSRRQARRRALAGFTAIAAGLTGFAALLRLNIAPIFPAPNEPVLVCPITPGSDIGQPCIHVGGVGLAQYSNPGVAGLVIVAGTVLLFGIAGSAISHVRRGDRRSRLALLICTGSWSLFFGILVAVRIVRTDDAADPFTIVVFLLSIANAVVAVVATRVPGRRLNWGRVLLGRDN